MEDKGMGTTTMKMGLCARRRMACFATCSLLLKYVRGSDTPTRTYL
jgi:hypothetical protein